MAEVPIGSDDLLKMQFDYGWKWFDFHAKQRTTMFNFFVIFAGFIFAAVAQISKTNDPRMMLLAFGISLFGVVVSLIFLGLDHRNARLVGIGEIYLRYFEANFFIPTKANYFKRDPKLGKLKPDGVGIFNFKDQVDSLCLSKIICHRTLIPLIFIIVTAIFFAAAVILYREYQTLSLVPVSSCASGSLAPGLLS